jgi:hypothetical protein
MKPVIGFTNKYYTLWEVSNPYKVDYDTYSVTKVDTTYLQNLSFSLDEAIRKVKELYGHEVEVDEQLRGVSARSFSTEIKREYTDSAFLFGKYTGGSFEEITDIDYKLWYWKETKNTGKFSQKLEDELVGLGVLFPFQNELYTLDDFERIVDSNLSKLEDDLFPHGHWGNGGEKVQLDGQITSTGSINSRYGTMFTYRLRVGEVSYLITSGSELPIEVGQSVSVAGTTKLVDFWSDWHGVRVVRTELKRVKLIRIYD